jgi:hypothetical protein
VTTRCLSSPFSSSFLINSCLLSNFLSIGTFIVSCEWILLELQSFEFFQPKNSEAKGMRPRIITVSYCSSRIFSNLCFTSY